MGPRRDATAPTPSTKESDLILQDERAERIDG